MLAMSWSASGDLFGDGVNIAARLQALAEPGGVCISGTAHEHVRRLLPSLPFVDLGPQTVKNIDEPVRAYRAVARRGTPAPAAGGPEPDRAKSLPLPDKPSIAVLPFTNMSGDPEQEYFADGLVEDIITALSRVRSFFVIARNSSFTYKGRAVDVRQIGRELGVRYIVEGSIRKSGSRVRIVGQLVDATTGHHVWADRFDGDMSDIFDLQDKVTESVVGAIEPSIRREEIRQARTKPTDYITAYDLYLRALPGFYSMTREGFAEVRRLTNEALSIDPDFTLAKALGAYIRSISVSQCWHEPDDIRVADPHGARGAGRGARRPDEPAVCRPGPGLQRQGLRDRVGRHRPLPPPQPQLRPELHRQRLGQRPLQPPAGRDRSFPSGHAPEPGRPGEGHRALGHRHELPDAPAVRGCSEWGEMALREMPGYGSSYRVVIGAFVGLGRMDEARAAARRHDGGVPDLLTEPAEADQSVAGQGVWRALYRGDADCWRARGTVALRRCADAR